MNQLTITTLHDLELYSKGNIVELPPFGEGQPFVARLGRPSMLELAKSGQIPNGLLSAANELFVTGKFDETNEALLQETFGVMESICKASFMEPTYDEIIASGVHLTDEQMLFIFSYSQKGVEALKPFREKQSNRVSAGNSSTV